MSKPQVSFMFHIPHTGKVIDVTKLEKKMNTRYPPTVVNVIDITTHKTVGSMHPSLALMKFR